MKKYLFFILFFISINIYSQQYIVETVITGLLQPVAFSFLPDNNVIITEKAGLTKIYTLNNTLVSTFWNFSDSTFAVGECGLLGVCLDPNYSVNHYIYFYYTTASTGYRVVRLTQNGNVGINPVIIFDETGRTNNGHIGGNIRFGRDNKLYITIGNNNVEANSQLLTTFKGKMLRINSDGSIPTDNPFYDDGNPYTGNDDRIWAYGLRNSFDFSFSPINDSLYATENGDGNPDEVNFIRKGKNYGYPICRGFCSPYNPLYQNPITEIPGNGTQDYAPTGVLIYTGNQMPELDSAMIVIGSASGVIYRGLLRCDLGNAPFYDTVIKKTILLDIYGYSTLMQGTDGYIYALLLGGELRRIKHNPTFVNNESISYGFSLAQNYPNPFNPSTNIKYQITKNSFVSLKIYDILGREVSSLVNENQLHGNFSVDWDGTNYPSGVYIYRLTSEDFTAEKKMVLIK